MTPLVRTQNALVQLIEPAALRRGLIAGGLWGLALTLALTALAAWQCGGAICLDEAAWLGSVSLATGVVAIGPVAAFGRRGER